MKSIKISNKVCLGLIAGFAAIGGTGSAKDITLNDGVGPGWGLVEGTANTQSNWATWGGIGPTGHDTQLQEDNEVEPSASAGQHWDLEALIWNTNTKWNNTTKSYDAAPGQRSLGILGGYDFSTGVQIASGSSKGDYLASDIFISIDGQPNPAVRVQPNGYHDVNNKTTGAGSTFNNGTDSNGIAFEYVIHFNNLTQAGGDGVAGGFFTDAPWDGSFTVYRLNANSTLRSVAFRSLRAANPWRYLGGIDNGTPGDTSDDAVVVGTGTAILHGVIGTKLTDAQAGIVAQGAGSDMSGLPFRSFKGDVAGSASHYYLEIPMDWTRTALPSGQTSIGGHITMGCGNDELVGNVTFSNTRVPDAGTSMMLLGAGMTILSIFGLRNPRR